jgi:hypothetical protein
MDIQQTTELITAIGALGTSAFGLVDATKVFGGGINHVGFRRIRRCVTALTPQPTQTTNSLPQTDILNTLKGNWFNGTDLGAQKAIAKSLIKLHLNSGNAAQVAKAANSDPATLTKVVEKQASASPLEPAEGDAYARFDMIVTAMLDEAYQRADQQYRNAARACAMAISIILALAAKWMLGDSVSISVPEAGMIGLVATPLAPIAKDLSTALSAAVNALQAGKK